MRPLYTAYTFGCIALAAFALQGCVPRDTNLDNLNVITKPYSLHFADSAGLLYSTYDGERFDVFNTTQGSPMQSIWTSGENIFVRFGTSAVYINESDGTYTTFNFMDKLELNPASFGPSAMINLPGYADYSGTKQDRIYAASNKEKGIAYNDYNGHIDSVWYYPQDEALGAVGNKVTSFARQANGAVLAFDDASRRLWLKRDFVSLWQNTSANGLPAAGSGQMFIITQRNDILAVMLNGDTEFGIWRSTDDGANFSKLPDIVLGGDVVKDITSAAAPFGKVLIVGTRDNGIWRLSGQGVWEPGSIGLKKGVHINGIVAKDNVFKGDRKGEYVFIATSNGMYRSDDLGQTWVRLEVPSVKPNFTALY